ncbi:MAG: NAD(P)-dependent glycerol-3-phosphate dehydrogenase [Deltaproteobacteria bacterium]|jgi:glycerol-3-phosphate dehydrogenase (NAD(P)+)|nr:NAD(P)-dependent glycerol-3-phosphate dehydrogenase [Deltaproteobacteria bacterium]
MKSVSVLGAGAWGTAISQLAAFAGYEVRIWAYEKEVIDSINKDHENKIYLPGFVLDKKIRAFQDINQVVAASQLVFNVVPVQFIRNVWKKVNPELVNRDKYIINASKGIEQNTLCLVSEIFESLFPGIINNFLVLSGPSFAEEVVKKVPTSVSLAAGNIELAARISKLFHIPQFRLYKTDDLIGVQLGGALKNVMAIASGAVDGLGLGLNTRAAMITRGLSEMARLGIALGASPETFSGLSGMGDLILTCTGNLSRNYTAGYRLGQGETIQEILESTNSVAEGVTTVKSVQALAQRHNIDMPITEAVYKGIYEDLSPKNAIRSILARNLKSDGI